LRKLQVLKVRLAEFILSEVEGLSD